MIKEVNIFHDLFGALSHFVTLFINNVSGQQVNHLEQRDQDLKSTKLEYL